MDLDELDRISVKYGQFKLTDYLNLSKSKISISIFKIGDKLSNIVYGENDNWINELMDKDREYENSTIMGYYGRFDLIKKNIHSNDTEIENTINVFMFNNSIIENVDRELYELIVFHEICHLLEKTEHYDYLDIKFNDNDNKIGVKINDIAQNIADKVGKFEDKDHNEIFGSLLNHFLTKYNRERKSQLINNAMKFNFLDDHSKEFE